MRTLEIALRRLEAARVEFGLSTTRFSELASGRRTFIHDLKLGRGHIKMLERSEAWIEAERARRAAAVAEIHAPIAEAEGV